MNVRDSELLAGILHDAGSALVEAPETADLIILNTCAVREHAEQRVIGRINQLSIHKDKRNVKIGVVGCMAQHLQEDLLEILPQLDFLLGPDAYRRIPELLEVDEWEPIADYQSDKHELYEDLPSFRSGNSPSAFVTIMRGCDRMCTFCVVPFTRGRERCRAWQDIIEETEHLIDEGVKEVVLLGQTVNAFRDVDMSFGDLLRKVSETGISRIRFTSPHPNFFSEDELNAIAECPNICESVHLPVQSGNSDMLRSMNRGYNREAYLQIARQIRERIPHVTLSTDIIVGFPGETEEQFEDTLSLMEECAFDSSFHFKYSSRSGTRAARVFVDDVPASVKQERLQRVIDLQSKLTIRSNLAMLDRSYEVLIEERGKRGEGQWIGRTRGNKIVVVESESDMLGAVADVKIEELGTWTLRGRLIK